MKFFRSFSLILVLLLLTGLMLRAHNVSTQGHWNSDGLLYYELARGFFFDGKVLSGKATRTIISKGNMEFYDNLFLQGKFGHILLLITSFLLSGIRIETVFYLNVALGTATLYLTYLLGSQIFNRNSGLIAMAISVFSLLLINYSRSALTPAGSMFFFTLGLCFLFKHFNFTHKKKRDVFIQPIFWAGLSIGFAFTIHYNLAYYFLIIYFSHLSFSLFSKDRRRQLLKDNLILAAGLTLPLVIFEFGYPLLYYLVYKKHILFSYFQEVMYNALEAGGGSPLWNYFPLFVWLGESPVYCILVLTSGIFLFTTVFRKWELSKGLILLIAFFPPIFLSTMDFPLVGRNLAPSLPLFAILVGNLINQAAEKFGQRFSCWIMVGLILALMAPGLPKLEHLYKIQSPYLQAKENTSGKGVLLLVSEDFYRNAILYNISDKISVVPSIDSILKDQKSRNYLLLTQPLEKNLLLDCAPIKTYNLYNSSWFPPIRYENRIANTAPANTFSNIFVLYDLGECLGHSESGSPAASSKSVTEIGKNYAAPGTSMTSLTRIHFRTGLDYLNHGYNDEAIFEFKEALASNPNLVQAHNNLALAFIKSEHFEEALDSINKSESLVPNIYETQNLFGLVYLSMGKFNQAIKYFKKAISINPKKSISYHYLINIYANIKKDFSKVQFYVEKLQSLSAN